MPPKKQDNAPKKVAVDKTFGMKNKKGGAAQRQIKQINATSTLPMDQRKKEAEKLIREKEKLAAEAAKREAAELFKPVQIQKVPFGVDPKTVLCQFFKKGACEKGRKCKFSHDLSQGIKGEKKSLYTDTRELEKEQADEEKKKDDMADWDEEKLRDVVKSKHGNPKTTTDKVCKFFIEAVENGKYGWFWTCPNGGDKCMYKHSLPPGYVFPLLLTHFPQLTFPLSQLRPQDKRTARRRKGPHGQIPPQHPNPRRLPRLGTPQTIRHSHSRQRRNLPKMEKGTHGQKGRRTRSPKDEGSQRATGTTKTIQMPTMTITGTWRL
jgi:hypothetical protein